MVLIRMIKKVNYLKFAIISSIVSSIVLSTCANAIPVNHINHSCAMNEIIRQPSLFSFPVSKMAQNVEFEADILSKRRHYNTCPPVCERYGTWVQGYIGHLSQGEGDCHQTAYNANGRGIMLGVDRRWNCNFRGGFAYAYSTENAGTDNSLESSVKINSQQGVIFGRYQLCDIYYSAVASFALNSYNQSPNIIDNNIDNNTDYFTGWQFDGRLEAGYDYKRVCGSYIYHITPYGLFNYGHLSTHAYQRDNGLSVHNEPVDMAQLGVGLLLYYDLRSTAFVYPYKCFDYIDPCLGNTLRKMNFCFYDAFQRIKYQYTPYIRLALTKDLFKGTEKTFSHLEGQDTQGCVSINAVSFDHAHLIGLGVAMDFHNNNFLSIEYDYERKSGYTLYAGFLKYRFEWC